MRDSIDYTQDGAALATFETDALSTMQASPMRHSGRIARRYHRHRLWTLKNDIAQTQAGSAGELEP